MLGITFTGIDEQTDLQRVRHLQAQGAEIGILLSATPEGRHRYPSLDWITAAARHLDSRVALHVCGRQARSELLAGRYDHLFAYFPRVQVNGVVQPDTLEDLLNLLAGASTLVTQHTPANAHLATLPWLGHELLVDASGGRGVLPDAWDAPETSKPVGFAGGLGPSTLRTAIPRILAVAKPGAWVDMEGRLRTPDDWFDVALAEEAMVAFQEACAA